MDYGIAFLLGLFGSLHCAGMCGPLALALPGTGRFAPGFVAGRLTCHLGRILTYCVLGVVFGLLGQTLVMAGIQRWVSIALGAMLLAGLAASRPLAASVPILALLRQLQPRMSALLRHRSFVSLAALGLLNGLLPCGLVYVACAGATTAGNILAGAQYMAVFGLGTLPMMLAISLSGKLVPISLRLKLLKAVPVAVVLLATLLILRGMSLGIPFVSPDLAGGPCCHR